MTMPFLYGLLTAVVFFCALMLLFYAGMRYERQKKPPDKVKEVDQEDELKRRQQKIHDDFMKTMNYSVEQAMQRKKVT